MWVHCIIDCEVAWEACGGTAPSYAELCNDERTACLESTQPSCNEGDCDDEVQVCEDAHSDCKAGAACDSALTQCSYAVSLACFEAGDSKCSAMSECHETFGECTAGMLMMLEDEQGEFCDELLLP